MATCLKQYPKVEDQSAFAFGKQEVILMLLNGIAKKIEDAKEAHNKGDLTEKGFYLGRATGIVDALRNMLEVGTGDQTAFDLDVVYNHIDLLLQAAIDPEGLHFLDEAAEIVENLAIGCNLMPPEMQQAPAGVMHA